MTITEFLQNGAGVPGGPSEAEPGAGSAGRAALTWIWSQPALSPVLVGG